MWRGAYDVCVRHLVGEVVVDDDVNPLDVDASAEQICGHQDALVELLRGREKGRGWGGEREESERMGGGRV